MSKVVSGIFVVKAAEGRVMPYTNMISANGEDIVVDDMKLSLRAGKLYIPHGFFSIVQLCDKEQYENMNKLKKEG